MLQLDFFQSLSESESLKAELRLVKESSDKVRKAMFARHNELSKKYIELTERLYILEKNICVQSKNNSE